MNEKNVDKLSKLMLSLLTYFYVPILLVLIFKSIIKLDFKNNYATSFMILDITHLVIVTIVISILYFKIIKKDTGKTKEEIKKSSLFGFFKTIVTGYVLCVLTSIFASYLESIVAHIFHVTITQSNNQNVIEELMKELPVLMIVSSCILAPIVEEMIFRCGVRQVIKDKRVFITVSGLIFGLMHVTDSVLLLIEVLTAGILLDLIIESNKENKIVLSVTALVSVLLIFAGIYFLIYGNLFTLIKALDPKEIIVSLSYICMGSILSLIYVKYDNIILNILVHAFNNTVSTILILSLM